MDEENTEGVIPEETPETTPSEPTNTPTDETNTDDTPTEEMIDVEYIKYYVKRIKKEVLSDREFIERRIAESKGEEVRDIEFTNVFSYESLDKEPDIFVEFVEDDWEEETELPSNLILIKSTTKTDVEYSYSEVAGETVELTTNFEYTFEFYFDTYTKQEPKPEHHKFGVCAECKHCMIQEFPFARYVCTLRKRTNNVTGKFIYYRCEDFNKYGECLLFEEIPAEEPVDEPTDEPTDDTTDDDVSDNTTPSESDGEENNG